MNEKQKIKLTIHTFAFRVFLFSITFIWRPSDGALNQKEKGKMGQRCTKPEGKGKKWVNVSHVTLQWHKNYYEDYFFEPWRVFGTNCYRYIRAKN